MGLIKNIATLEKLQKYLTDTNFGNQSLGHSLTLSFMPTKLAKKLEDKRYSFSMRHRLIKNGSYSKSTYSEVIIDTILQLAKEIKGLPEATLKLYTDVGLIEDNKCTAELISTVVANSVAYNPATHKGNTTTKLKYSDNLMNIFPEFSERNVTYFLSNLDKYQPSKQ